MTKAEPPPRFATFRDPPPPFEAASFEAATVARAARGWQVLYEDERDSLIAATLLVADLVVVEAPLELLRDASRVVEDETRHVRVCDHVLRTLGHPAKSSAMAPRTFEDLPVLERLARLAVPGFLVGESLSAAAFQRARTMASVPIAVWAYTELLRDEARHGPLGARVGAFVLPKLPPAFAKALWPECALHLQTMESRVGGPFDDAKLEREPNPEVMALESLGLLRGSQTCDAFVDCIAHRIVPKLRELGVV